MSTTKYQRRTPEAWQSLIHQHRESGLSGAQFCKQQEIPYASFSKWRQRLSEDVPQSTPAVSSAQASGFIDLSTLAGAEDRLWSITLKLGNGVELRLNQH